MKNVSDATKIEKMICQPTHYFDNPGEVLQLESLSQKEKLNILESWKHTCEQIQKCNDEGMTNDDNRTKNEEELSEVSDALSKIKPQDKK